jgi:hypothetical protein
MKHSKVGQMPDVPEILDKILKTENNISKILSEIYSKNHPNIFLNGILLFVVGYVVKIADTQEEIDDVINSICKTLELNSKDILRQKINIKE